MSKIILFINYLILQKREKRERKVEREKEGEKGRAGGGLFLERLLKLV